MLMSSVAYQTTYQHKPIDEFMWEYEGATSYNSLKNRFGWKIDKYDHAVAAMLHFPYFTQEVLGYTMPDHSFEIADIIINNERSVHKAARGHLKSTVLQQLAAWVSVFPQNILKNFVDDPRKDLYTLQISYGSEQASEWHGFYQDFVGDAISDLQLPITFDNKSAQTTKLSHDVTCVSRGMMTSMRGKHPHLILGDDLLSDRRFISPELQRRIYFQGVIGMTMPGTIVGIVGTPLTFNDLLAELSEMPVNKHDWKYDNFGNLVSKRGYISTKYAAIRVVDGVRIPLWGIHRPLEWLDARKDEIGEIMFTREFMCDVVSDAGAIFDPDTLQLCNRSNEFIGRHKGGRMIGGMDLGFTADTRGSETSLMIVEEYMNQVLIMRDLWHEHTDSTKRKIEKLHWYNYYYGGIEYHIEDNAAQTDFVEVCQDEVYRKEFTEIWLAKGLINRPLNRLNVQGSTTGRAKTEGILSLEPKFANQQFLFPTGNQKSLEITNTVQAELSTWIFNPDKDKVQCLAPTSDISMSLYILARNYFSPDTKKWDWEFG